MTDIDARLRSKDRGERRWYVNGQGQTFALVAGPVEFDMGSPQDEPERTNDLTRHRQVIDHQFAVAVKEVGAADYQRFVKSAKENEPFGIAQEHLVRYSSAEGPMIGVTWYGAAAYCNWLSEREKIPKDQWCYLHNDKGEYAEGMKIKADALKLKGYRLPTEAEWEFACRAGAATSRYHALSVDLLRSYARYLANSGVRASQCGSLLPNDLGLFDMPGNAYERCQEPYDPGEATIENRSHEYINENPRILRGGSFYYRPALVRSAYRDRDTPSSRATNGGFRLARTYRSTHLQICRWAYIGPGVAPRAGSPRPVRPKTEAADLIGFDTVRPVRGRTFQNRPMTGG